MKIKLSLIIPVYNAEAFILNSLLQLTRWKQTLNYSVQIILVNDGSTDATFQLIDHYINTKDSSIECHTYKRNKGKGFAVKQGMLLASGEYRIFTDVDIPFGFKIFDRFIYYLDFKEFDLVVGDRTLTGSAYYTEIPLSRKIGSYIYSFLVGRFVTGGHFDTQCGIKGLRASAANDIFKVNRIKGFAFDVELLYVALKRNYDIKRLPVVLICQEGSSVNMFVNGLGMFLDIFKIKLNHIQGNYKK